MIVAAWRWFEIALASAGRRWPRRRSARAAAFAAAGVVAAVLVWAVVAETGTRAEEPSPTTGLGLVRVEVRFSDDARRDYPRVAWREGLTALDALRSLAKAEPPLACVTRGAGETAFVSQIGDVKNQGGAGRNWLFEVNGKLADRGAGVFVLRPGDHVLWKFDAYR